MSRVARQRSPAKTAKLLLLGCCLGLPACSLLPTAGPLEVHRYTLDHTAPAKTFDPLGPVILVAPVKVSTVLASQRMMYRRTPHEVAYYTRSQWAAPPAGMLEPLIIDALEATGRFRAVVPQSLTVAADLRLELALMELHQDVASDPGSVHLGLRAQLLRLAPPRVLSTRQFDYTATVQANNAASGADAMNSLLDTLLRDVAKFCIDAGVQQTQPEDASR